MSKVQDGRLPPFSWVSRNAMTVLRTEFRGQERAYAVAIYTTLAELASDQRRAHHDGIEASRRDVAEAAGVSIRTLDKYTNRLRRIGLLGCHQRREEGLNLPTVWSLVEPEGGGASAAPPLVQPVQEGGATAAPSVNAVKEELQEERQEDPLNVATQRSRPQGGRTENEAERGEVVSINTAAARRCAELLEQELRKRYDVKPGSRAFHASKGWEKAARAMLDGEADRAPVSEDYLRAGIVWVCRHPRWGYRVRSFGTLRSEWDQIVQEAEQQRANGNHNGRPLNKAERRRERTAQRLAELGQA